MRRTAEESTRTREKILEAALEEFAEEGWNGSSLVVIARRAKLTRGAIYHHFANKEDLLMAVLAEQWQLQMRPVTAILAQDWIEPQQCLQDFLETYVRQLSAQKSFRQLAVVSTIVAPQVLDIGSGVEQRNDAMQGWCELLAPMLSQSTALEAEQALFAVMAFVYGVTIIAATEPQRLPSGDGVTAICRTVAVGLFGQTRNGQR